VSSINLFDMQSIYLQVSRGLARDDDLLAVCSLSEATPSGSCHQSRGSCANIIEIYNMHEGLIAAHTFSSCMILSKLVTYFVCMCDAFLGIHKDILSNTQLEKQ
jgi:hypothetical protein